MTTVEEQLHMQYFYNSVIEFIYFTIIYIESYGFIFLHTLAKHVKFFKNEVSEFISSFAGHTLDEKLHTMLNMLNCFEICENKIKICEIPHLKNSVFEDLIFSKIVDLALKGFTNIDYICKNLNVNNIIFIDNENILNIIQKSSHFSVNNDFSVSILHIHGILGFEGYTFSFIINYFQDILQHDQTLSYNEIEQHRKCMSFCGLHNILPVLCILYCSNHFHCQNGIIRLKKKSKKVSKQKPLQMELLMKNIPGLRVSIGRIVHEAYGRVLQRWTGEISSLKESSGMIQCVVDFTNGHQGVFNIYFNKSAIKIISEICNLNEYLKVRDIVEFDAEYSDSRKIDNGWIATRVKILNPVRSDIDESLLDQLRHNSELERKNCVETNCCLSNVSISPNCFDIKICKQENLFFKINQSDNLDFHESKIVSNGVLNTLENHESSENFTKAISNLFLSDYLFTFGHIFMLLEDKGMAVAKRGGELFNILFMRDSIYPPNKLQNLFIKGQKVLAIIPYIEEVDLISVATFVYGLSDEETRATEENFTNPTEFALKTFLPNISKHLVNNCGNSCCDILNNLLTFQPVGFASFQHTAQLHEFYNSIIKLCKISFCKISLLPLFKTGSGENVISDIISYIKKLSKSIILKRKFKNKQKLKNALSIKFSPGKLVHFSKFCDNLPYKKIIKDTLLIDSNLSMKFKSRNFSSGSLSSLSSFKSCFSSISSETFYSCDSNETHPECSYSLPENINIVNDKIEFNNICVSDDEQVISLPNFNCTVENVSPVSEFKTEKRNLVNKCKKRSNIKYLQSFPFLKPRFNKKKNIRPPNIIKSVCENCHKCSVQQTASISLITDSFFFYNVNINGDHVVLPLPKRTVPEKLQEKIKLNSCHEVTVIPNTLIHLSHILLVNVI